MKSLLQFKEWLKELNHKCNDPDLKYFINIIEMYQEENSRLDMSS